MGLPRQHCHRVPRPPGPAPPANEAGADGLFFHGGTTQLGRQVIALAFVALFSFAATWLIATVIQKTIGFRVYRDDELTGLDTTFHAESAYDITGNSNRY